jgi:hypothetical protein
LAASTVAWMLTAVIGVSLHPAISSWLITVVYQR